MLKYKIISQYNNIFVWDVRILREFHPTVGNFIREIKFSKLDTQSEKDIAIYKKGIVVGEVVFKGDETISWFGKASEIWESEVEKCEMTANGNECYSYKIYIKEPREGAIVFATPIVPWLINIISKPIPVGMRN